MSKTSDPVISLQDFRRKKQLRAERRSSVVDSFDPQGKDQSPPPRRDVDLLAKRLEGLKGVLKKVNKLMDDLRALEDSIEPTTKP